MVANVANRLPHFCVFGKAKDHDSKMEDELFNSLKEGDIGIADRAYNCFKALYRQSGAACSYSRFAALVRAIVWLKKDAMAILRSYGIAPPPDPGGATSGMPYLPGFEKMFLKSVG